MFQKILVAIPVEDELSFPLARTAASLATTHGATLRCVTVMPGMPATESGSGALQGGGGGGGYAAATTIEMLRQSALAFQTRLEQALQTSDRATPPVQHEFREGALDLEIVEAAHDWQADLIMIGANQRGFLERLLYGAPSEEVLRAAPCAVIAIPRSALAEAASDLLTAEEQLVEVA